jgi:hypothetical protein
MLGLVVVDIRTACHAEKRIDDCSPGVSLAGHRARQGKKFDAGPRKILPFIA